MFNCNSKLALFLGTIALCAATSFAAHAQSVIRDAEIERDIRVMSSPVFEAAGLNPSAIRIVLINEDTVNAFVAGGQNLFLFSGLILDTKNIGELMGVIAHESGHIAGGHLIRTRAVMERASIESVIATVLGVAIGVGAGDAQAGVATALGGGEMVKRNFLRHSRAMENAADQAGMAALENAGYSSAGMVTMLERLSAQEVLPESQRSSYVMTHPLSRERMQTVESFVSRSAYKDKEWPLAWQEKFRRIQAKILAFTVPSRALRDYAHDDSFAGRYAVAIAQYRMGKITEALAILDTLDKQEPQNAYLRELRGQILFEQGRTTEAVAAYRKASSLAPEEGMIHFYLAQALLQDESKNTDEAISHLLQARNKGERDTPIIYRWLAVAYGRQGKEGLAKLSLAEEALLKNDLGFAISQAQLAGKMIPESDTGSRQRAKDIIAAANRKMAERKKD